MKVQGHRRYCLLLFLGLGFYFLFPSYSYSVQASSHEVNTDVDYLENNTICNLKKYIMDCYNEKYGSSQALKFEDFVADELPSSCEVLSDKFFLTLSVPKRQLIGSGSHRQLSSTIRFHFQSDSSPYLPSPVCKAIIVERLPSGVFADPFELEHLHKRGVFADVAVFGDTNLELPSFLSNWSTVEIHINVGDNFLSEASNGTEISVALPLHARYPPLNKNGYAEVVFGAPDLFLSCSVEGKTDMDKQSCIFAPIIDDIDTRISAPLWRIPCGVSEHAGMVTLVTFAAAFISAFSIITASIFYSGVTASKHSKQS